LTHFLPSLASILKSKSVTPYLFPKIFFLPIEEETGKLFMIAVEIDRNINITIFVYVPVQRLKECFSFEIA